MKNLKIISTLLIFSLHLTMNLKGADYTYVIKINTDLFHGTWSATLGDTEYQIKFERITLPYIDSDNEYCGEVEALWGKLTVRENGVIIKETAEAGFDSRIRGFGFNSPYHIYFWYTILPPPLPPLYGGFDFIIDETDTTKAVLKLGKKRQGSGAGDYDIPDNLTFTKVE